MVDFPPGQTPAAEPYRTIGQVTIWSLGGEWFRIETPRGSEDVEGMLRAERTARELATKSSMRDAARIGPS
jgi:hypothetical protein